MTPLLVALGAGAGGGLRYVVAGRLDRRWPWGTWAVNVIGSFVLGAMVGVGVSGPSMALLGVGLCGGFTTYSSFAVQVTGAGWRTGTAYAGLSVVCGLLAAAAGLAL